MKLPFSLGAAALSAALLGCGGNKPAAIPVKTEPAANHESGSSAGAKEIASPATTAGPVAPQKTKSKVVLGPPEPPKLANEELRSLAARLVDKSPDGSWRVNEAAALELEKLGDSAYADLVALLGDAKPAARRGAAYYLLPKFDPEDARQVAGYLALLGDQEPFLRSLGVQAVRKMPKADQAAAVPQLSKMLAAQQESSDDNRAALSRLLGSLKQEAAPALESLMSGAKDDESPRVRGAYLLAISQIASPMQALPALRQGLGDQDSTVRLVAAARLRQLGKEAAPAAEDLAQALEDADPSVREAAAQALIQLGAAAVEPLIKHVDSKQAPTRQLAIACLGKIGPAAKSALPQVEKHLTDEDPEVKKIAEAVVRILKGS